MRDVFSSLGDDSDNIGKVSKRISFDRNEPDNSSENNVFTFKDDAFEDFNTGRHYDDRKDADSYSDYSSEDEIKFNFDFDEEFNEVFSKESSDFELPHESTDDEFAKPKRNKKTQRPKKKGKGMKKAITAVICILLAFVLAVFGYAYILCGKIDYQPSSHKKNEYISENMLFGDKNVSNILIIGTDKRKGEATYRSDSMILVSLDKNTKKIKLTSFLRDSYVYIPAKDYSTKLNAACSYGGPQMVIDTLEYNFKVHIDKYVMVDFSVFRAIINDLDGITLTMTEEEAACIRRESGRACKAGTHTYHGRLALWYARIRHLDSDFKRTERQRKVIQAVVDKIKKTDPVTLSNMLSHVLPMIQSDLSQTEVMKMGITALPLLRGDIEEMQIPVSGTWSNATINGAAVLKLDIEKNSSLLMNFIYGDK